MTLPDKRTDDAALKLDPQRDLRAAVASVERALSRHANAGELVAPWRELVRLLKLEPAPALRACPACGNLAMRAATRCGHCWSPLVAPVEAVG